LLHPFSSCRRRREVGHPGGAQPPAPPYAAFMAALVSVGSGMNASNVGIGQRTAARLTDSEGSRSRPC
jgi:hypothetical protein